jgi:hypothetical protein
MIQAQSCECWQPEAGGPLIMNDQEGRATSIETLRSLLDRLGSCEVELDEAKSLRLQVMRLLDGGENLGETP